MVLTALSLGQLGAPLFQEVLLAKAGTAIQEGSPEGGAMFSDFTAVCQQLSTNSGPCGKY